MDGLEPPLDPESWNLSSAALVLYLQARIHAIEDRTSDPNERLRRAVAVIALSRLLTRSDRNLEPIETALGNLARAAGGEFVFPEPRTP